MIKWDTNATDEEGNTDFAAVQASLCYKCPFCESEFLPTKEQLADFNRSSIWESENPSAPQGKIGFHTTAFAFLDPYTLLTEYINAKSRAKDGDFSQLKIFYQKRLAEAWTEKNEVVIVST
jgi:hypothetical protein